ncbi:MAG: hypothetical protein ABS879_04950, partial [Eubacteriales bacterium]
MKEEIIGKVKLNYSWYSGEDLYSDGDAVENRILEIVRNEEGYEFALDEYTSWPILYHLTRQRENIVLPMEIGKTDEVLDVLMDLLRVALKDYLRVALKDLLR